MLEIEVNDSQESTIDLRLDESSQTLHFQLSDNRLLASVLNDDGVFGVKPECMSDFKGIKSLEVLKAFLANAFIKVSQFDNGDYDIKIHQKAKGGMEKEDQKYHDLTGQFGGKNVQVFGALHGTSYEYDKKEKIHHCKVEGVSTGVNTNFDISDSFKIYNNNTLTHDKRFGGDPLSANVSLGAQYEIKNAPVDSIGVQANAYFKPNADRYNCDTFSGYGVQVNSNITPNLQAYGGVDFNRNADRFGADPFSYNIGFRGKWNL